MHSIKNISERNKIDTQSRADAYIRRKRLTKKNLQTLGKYMKKHKKTKKTQKKPLGWVFLKKPGFFQPWLQAAQV
jgi:hypothetical protein